MTQLTTPPFDASIRTGRWQRRVGLFLAATTALLVLALGTALAVVTDLRPLILGVSATAAVLLLVGLRRVGTPRTNPGPRVLGLIALFVSAYAAYDLTLAYRTEEVSFSNGDATLRGTLYLPRRAGPHPAIVLVHGSGTQPRGEYRFYARMYARNGVAALAYDKRGSGQSTGHLRSATYEQLGSDAAEGVELLRRRADIDKARVGIWGLSEGVWTGPLAARQSRAAFLVMISATSLTPAGQVQYETARRVQEAGFGGAVAREASDLYARLAEFQRSGADRDGLNRSLSEATTKPWFEAARYLESSVPEYSEALALEWFPAWKARMDIDPLPIVASLPCPVLVQNGGIDPKLDAVQSNEEFRQALARGGNPQFTGIVYPRAAHNIVEWRLPFRIPPPLFASGYLATQVEWVRQQAGLKR